MRNEHSENLCEHSFEVAVIAHALAVIGNKRFGKNYNGERAAFLGLYHDTPETLTGDMPTPVKYYNTEINNAYKAVEKVDENGFKTYERVWSVDAAKSPIVIDAIDALYEEGTDAEWKVETYDGVEALYTPSNGTVAWKVNIPESARYSVVIEYYPVYKNAAGEVVSKSTAIERIFRINSAVPFLEARYLTLSKNYANNYVAAEYKLGAGESASDYLGKAQELGLVATSETREDATYIVYVVHSLATIP